MCPNACAPQIELAVLRSERAYWQAMHRKAVERAEERERKLLERIAELEAKLKQREQQLFGRKSEQTGASEAEPGGSDKKRSRGQQPGARGHGRRRHDHLPKVVQDSELPPGERHCPNCGLPFKELAGAEESEQIEIEVRAHRRVLRRKKYLRRCQCPGLARIVTAPGPAKLIAKGLYGISVWAMVLLDKFLFQRPTHRLLLDLRTHGLSVPQGSLTDGLKRLVPLFAPLREAIIEHQRQARHWHADETRWMVFVEIEGKIGHRWFLWMICSADAVVFILDPSRSAQVPSEHFGDAQGIVSADRYSAYKALAKMGNLSIAYCWAHVRRDFLEVARSWPALEGWAMAWVELIRELYARNDARVDLWAAGKEYAVQQTALEVQVALMEAKSKEQMVDPALHAAARKKLESLERHWSGLLLFVRFPWVPMDNNTAEREQRGPVVGRKNYYGSGSLWSGELAATMFSVLHTLRRCGINPRPWLHAYLETCAEAGGKVPPDFADFLPWNLSEERQRQWAMPGEPQAEVRHGRNAISVEILRAPVHRPRARADPPDRPRGSQPDPLGDLAAGV